jgi:hypothetical protein
LDQEVLAGLRERYDTAVRSGIIHNRLRAWDVGNHPGYSLGTWLRDYREQVFLFTREFAVSWTNNVSERGAKAAKRHRASRVLAQPRHARPLVPPAQLPRLGRRPRHHRTRRHRQRHRRKPWLPPLPAIS